MKAQMFAGLVALSLVATGCSSAPKQDAPEALEAPIESAQTDSPAYHAGSESETSVAATQLPKKTAKSEKSKGKKKNKKKRRS